MNAFEKITKARAGLILDHPFFGALALRLQLVEDAGIKTAAVNGIALKYNPAWIEDKSLDETKAVLAHEVMHLAAAHHCRRGGRDLQKWNIAGDFAINQILQDAGMKLLKDAPLNPDYKGLEAEAIYNRLPQDDDGGGGGGNQGGGQQPPGNQPGDQPGNQPDNDPGGCGGVEDFPGEDGQGKPEPSEIAKQEQEWKVAVEQAANAARSCGKMPGGMERIVEELTETEVDWKEALQQFVTQQARNDYSWKRPNARYMGTGCILPSLYSEELPPIIVAVDTSGSIAPHDLEQFTAEIDAILEQHKTTVHVIYCDRRVQGDETFTEDNRPVRLHAKGGGGTAFAPVFEYVDEQQETPSCLVYLTDLEGSYPQEDPGYPVLWVETGGGRRPSPPFGEHIRMRPGA